MANFQLLSLSSFPYVFDMRFLGLFWFFFLHILVHIGIIWH